MRLLKKKTQIAFLHDNNVRTFYGVVFSNTKVSFVSTNVTFKSNKEESQDYLNRVDSRFPVDRN